MITTFDSYQNTNNPKHVEIDAVLEHIRLCTIQPRIDDIKNAIAGNRPETEIKNLKKKLPCILFAGKFTRRKDSALVEHSGFVILDFDHEENPAQKRDALKQYPFIYSAFISPTGRGVKAVVKIPAVISDHRARYNALQLVFPELDGTSVNESRICYMGADSGIWVNKEAIAFADKVEVATQAVTAGSTERLSGGTNYRKIAVAVEMVRGALDGQKHITLLKAAKLLGGYIESGAVGELEAIYALETEIKNKNIEDFPAAQKTIKEGIEFGKNTPIFELEREFHVRPTATIQPTETGVTTIDAVWDSMKKSFKEGKKRGETTHFFEFDKHFTWKRGEVTLIIGRPNFGKTEWAMQLMLFRSVFDGWKWAIFTPENCPADEFYDSLIHSYIGKTTDPYYGDQQMTMEEYEQGYRFIKNHFFYVYPEVHTIEEIDANFIALIEKHDIDGCFIDPFNQLEISHNQRDDQFLSEFLRNKKRFATKYDLCFVISTHPKSMSRDRNGGYPVPDLYDISGGAMWGNKIDNVMVVDRPEYAHDVSNPSVDIHVKKIKKQKLVGVPGIYPATFMRRTNRYYTTEGSPLDRVKPQPLTMPPQKEYGSTKIPFTGDVRDHTEPNKDTYYSADDFTT